jgi:hypothetical protein
MMVMSEAWRRQPKRKRRETSECHVLISAVVVTHRDGCALHLIWYSCCILLFSSLSLTHTNIFSFFRGKQYDDAVEMYSKAIYFCPNGEEHKEQMVRLM